MATPNLVEEENLISSNNDMEISSEIELLVTIKDIQDELGMIEKVLNEQGDTVKRLPDLLPDDQSNGNLDEFDRDANYRTQTVNTQLEDANRVERSLNHLLDLKQKQVNINEAVSSRKQAESTAMQGNYIMVFTIVTVIFSPLSFMAGLFALDISYFPHDSEGDVKFNSGWVTLRLSKSCQRSSLINTFRSNTLYSPWNDRHAHFRRLRNRDGFLPQQSICCEVW